MSAELFSGVCFAKSLASCSPLSSTSWKKQKSVDWSASATKHIPSGQTELLSQALYPLSPSANAADQDLKLPGDASSPALVLPPSPTSILSSYARSQGEEHSSHSPSNSWAGSPLDPSMGERGASDSAAQDWTSTTTTKSQNNSSQRENFALSYDKSFVASNPPRLVFLCSSSCYYHRLLSFFLFFLLLSYSLTLIANTLPALPLVLSCPVECTLQTCLHRIGTTPSWVVPPPEPFRKAARTSPTQWTLKNSSKARKNILSTPTFFQMESTGAPTARLRSQAVKRLAYTVK